MNTLNQRRSHVQKLVFFSFALWRWIPTILLCLLTLINIWNPLSLLNESFQAYRRWNYIIELCTTISQRGPCGASLRWKIRCSSYQWLACLVHFQSSLLAEWRAMIFWWFFFPWWWVLDLGSTFLTSSI